jgi:glutaminyl-peptide cyclotransferase
MTQFAGWSIAVVVAGCVAAPFWWLTSSSPALTPDTPQLPHMDADDPPKKSGFAVDAVPAAAIKFDGERGVKYVKLLCDIGPRVSGSDGMKKQQEVLERHFKGLGATVTRQEFKAKQNSRREKTDMTNLIVTWHPEKARRVLICAHYDTRPIADQEADRGNWNKPFVSANDGTGGVALMMELAHHMKDLKSEFGVDFVIVDGEEYVFVSDRSDKYFFGSEYFAEDYMKTKGTRKHRYDAGVVLDLCTGKDAKLKVELHSYDVAPKLVEQIWGTAKEVGAKSFLFEPGYEVQDDHLALNRAGIPTVDIIDFDYAHWHKLTDTPDKVSAAQMTEVATVLTTWIGKIK